MGMLQAKVQLAGAKCYQRHCSTVELGGDRPTAKARTLNSTLGFGAVLVWA